MRKEGYSYINILNILSDKYKIDIKYQTLNQAILGNTWKHLN